jgi:hypothetical protein
MHLLGTAMDAYGCFILHTLFRTAGTQTANQGILAAGGGSLLVAPPRLGALLARDWKWQLEHAMTQPMNSLGKTLGNLM